MSDRYRFYISCAPGIETILARECQGLGLIPMEKADQDSVATSYLTAEDHGGTEFKADITKIMACNLHLRTASRVTVRLGEFDTTTFADLRKKASHLEWQKFLQPGQPVNIQATCHKSKLYHSGAVEERVLHAINDRFPKAPGFLELTPARTGQLVLVRLVNDHCTVSIDSSGELLHRRGYRLATGKAPLRETLAAAMILGSGWSGDVPLIDPFCGSGTIPIEAALIASNIPPGIGREFSFEKWPIFQPEMWLTLRKAAREMVTQNQIPIFGYDRDKGAIESAIANASRAGQKNAIAFIEQAVSYLESPSETGWIITNPPYGKRVQNNKDLRDLYARFGSILKSKFANWNAGILCSDPRLIGNLSLGDLKSRIFFDNGGINTSFNLYHI